MISLDEEVCFWLDWHPSFLTSCGGQWIKSSCFLGSIRPFCQLFQCHRFNGGHWLSLRVHSFCEFLIPWNVRTWLSCLTCAYRWLSSRSAKNKWKCFFGEIGTDACGIYFVVVSIATADVQAETVYDT